MTGRKMTIEEKNFRHQTFEHLLCHDTDTVAAAVEKRGRGLSQEDAEMVIFRMHGDGFIEIKDRDKICLTDKGRGIFEAVKYIREKEENK